MAADFIKITRGGTGEKFGADLANAKNVARALIDQLEMLKGIAEHNIANADYTAMETIFGLSAGNGTVVYNLLAGTLGALKGTVQSSDALTLIDRIG